MSPRCPHCRALLEADAAACMHCGRAVPGGAIREAQTHIAPLSRPAPISRDAIQTEPDLVVRMDGSATDDLGKTLDEWDIFRMRSTALQEELLHLATDPIPDLSDARISAFPEDLPDVEILGAALATIRLGGEWPNAHRWVGLGLAAGSTLALGFIVVVLVRMQELKEAIGSIASMLTLLGFGLWYSFRYQPKLTATYWICENGIAWQRGSSVGYKRWEDVLDFQMSLATGRPIFWITIHDEHVAVLSAGHARNTVDIARHIEAKASAANLLPRLRRIIEGEQVCFGAIAISRHALTGPNLHAAWREIIGVSATDNEMAFVLRNGPAALVRYRDIGFPIVVMAIVRILSREHGNPPDSD
jgi:hypothetical protein